MALMKKREMQLGVSRGEPGIYVAVWQMSARKNQDDIFAVARQLEMRSQSMFGREHGHALCFFVLGISVVRGLRWKKSYIGGKSNSRNPQKS